MLTIIIDLTVILYPRAMPLMTGIEWVLNPNVEDFVTQLEKAVAASVPSQTKTELIFTADVAQDNFIHVPVTHRHKRCVTLEQLQQEIALRLRESKAKLPHLRKVAELPLTPLRRLQKSPEKSMIFLTSCTQNADFFEAKAKLGRSILFDMTYPLMSEHKARLLQTLGGYLGAVTVFLDLDDSMHPSVLALSDPHRTQINANLVEFCKDILKTAPQLPQFAVCTARYNDLTLIQMHLIQICKSHLETFAIKLPETFFETLERKCKMDTTPHALGFEAQITAFYGQWEKTIVKLSQEFKPPAGDVEKILQEIRDKQADPDNSLNELLGLYPTRVVCKTFVAAAGIAINSERGIFTAGQITKAEQMLNLVKTLPLNQRPKIMVLIDDDSRNLTACKEHENEFSALGIKLLCVKVLRPGQYDPELLQQAAKYIRQTSIVHLSPHKKPRVQTDRDEKKSSVLSLN